MGYTKRIKILWAETTELAAGLSNSTTVHTFFHLLYVRYGKGTFRCDDVTYNVSKGNCIVVFPHVYHEIPAENHNLMGFHEIKFEINDPYLFENLLKTQPIFIGDSFFETALAYICENYTQEKEKEILINIDYLLSALLTSMFLDHAVPQKPSSQYVVGSKYNHTTQKIISYVEKNANAEFKLEYLGQSLGMHPAYLCGNFKKNTGHSIIDYLSYVRIRVALQTMYFRSDTPINEIAFQCGFGSLSNFNRMFKRFTGTTPSTILNFFEHHSDTAGQIDQEIHNSLIVIRYSSIDEAFAELYKIAKRIESSEFYFDSLS